MCQCAFLEELRRQDVQHDVDRNGKLVLKRKLPEEIANALPLELVPEPVLKLYTQWQQGTLQKQREKLGAPRYHDRVKMLRRYHLIEPVNRKSPEQKRIASREYLRNWRRRHNVAADNSVGAATPLTH